LKQIAAFNEYKGEEQMGVTLFSDLTDEEFQSTYLTQLNVPEEVDTVEAYNTENAPASLDWRTSGRVTDVKNQGQCGSCWAFSTTGVLEGFFHSTTGKLPSLSEQQLVDCAGILYGNLGCNGGMPSRALNYVKAKGLTTEAAYPYTAVKGNCQTQGGDFQISSHTAVDASDNGTLSHT
jgi:cathepsin L